MGFPPGLATGLRYHSQRRSNARPGAFLEGMTVVSHQVDRVISRRWVRRWIPMIAIPLVLLALAAGGGFLWVRHILRASLPRLSGTIAVSGPHAAIRIDRDALGIPTIQASHRDDVAFGLGFVHAQDRFFQMDAIRRSAAGELAEIVGPGSDDRVLKQDRFVRTLRFRKVAQKAIANLSEPDQRWLDAYVAGVNAGLRSLDRKPFEYLFLGAEPAPWKAEDTMLAVLAMFLDLQGKDRERESARGVIRDVLPDPLAEFLCTRSSPDWEAPVQGGPIALPPIPGPEVFDLRREPDHLLRGVPLDPTPLEELETLFAASNNWAISAQGSAHGGAIAANDMHLRLGVPNTWYRASLIWPQEREDLAAEGYPQPRQVTGATLPGGPTIVIGSNGQIAWGLTNSAGDWSDLIELEVDRSDPNSYWTPEDKRPFEHHGEIIKVKGRTDEILDIQSTIWGPVIDRDHKGCPRALRLGRPRPGRLEPEPGPNGHRAECG